MQLKWGFLYKISNKFSTINIDSVLSYNTKEIPVKIAFYQYY